MCVRRTPAMCQLRQGVQSLKLTLKQPACSQFRRAGVGDPTTACRPGPAEREEQQQLP